MSNLTDCKTCGQRIAKTAKICPACGAKHQYTSPEATLFALVLIGGVMLYSWISDLIPEAPKPPLSASEQQAHEERQADRAAERERENKESHALAACQVLLERSLRNPDSLKWDSLHKRKVLHNSTGIRVARGYSAENLFGGRNRGLIVCQFDQNNRLIDHTITER